MDRHGLELEVHECVQPAARFWPQLSGAEARLSSVDAALIIGAWEYVVNFGGPQGPDMIRHVLDERRTEASAVDVRS